MILKGYHCSQVPEHYQISEALIGLHYHDATLVPCLEERRDHIPRFVCITHVYSPTTYLDL